MNTIEQALANQARLRCAHVTWRDTIDRCTEAADTIDALLAELELARMKTYLVSISEAAGERDALKTLVTAVHKAKGRYHSQLAMCARYDACGLPNVKPVSGERT